MKPEGANLEISREMLEAGIEAYDRVQCSDVSRWNDERIVRELFITFRRFYPPANSHSVPRVAASGHSAIGFTEGSDFSGGVAEPAGRFTGAGARNS